MDALRVLWVSALLSASSAAGPAVSELIVKEDDPVFLLCSLQDTDLTDKDFDWKKDDDIEVFFYNQGRHYGNGLTGQNEHFKGRVSHFSEQLRSGNASVVIHSAKVADTGNYTCDIPGPDLSHIRARVQLTVVPILKNRLPENIPGASPEPKLRIFNKTEDGGTLLRCEVLGAFPKPDVVIKNSSGDIIPPKEKPKVTERKPYFDTVLLAVVTKEGNYYCEATQRTIHHQINDTTFVPMSEEKTSAPETSTGWIVAGIVSALLVGGVVVLLILVAKGCIICKKDGAAELQHKESENPLNQQDGV